MPTDVGHSQKAAAPLGLDDKFGKKDKNFRRYESAVERALSLFDTALQEWADYISFLGRLLKALQTKPAEIDTIPSSRLVARRLSQCLNPMLPSGVHQKALEVYNVVFAILGRGGLTKELPFYLPGLSPLLSFASLSVKPALLSLFETYIIILDPQTLRPALKSIILALLPGLEEEGSEEFERTHALLNKFRCAIGKSGVHEVADSDVKSHRYFWQSLFLATITSPSRRQGALAYLVRNLPRLSSSFSTSDVSLSNGSTISGQELQLPPEIQAIASPEPGLLIRCIVAGLQDEQLLIQRGFLDLLVTHLPLNSIVIQRQVVPEDLELLVSAAASVVARREMSLNRRLWAWFLGQAAVTDTDRSEPNSPESSGSRLIKTRNSDSPRLYFEQYGLDPLTNGLLKMFTASSFSPVAKARPFRICLSVMDRWEVGGLVIPRIFRQAMESMHKFEELAPSPDSFFEVLRSANVFFDGIQSRLIWKELIAMLFEAFDLQAFDMTGLRLEKAQRLIDLVWFTVTKFNVREEEMLSLHLPNALIMLLVSVREFLMREIQSVGTRVTTLIQSAYKIANYLLDLIPKRVFTTSLEEQGYSASAQYNITEGKNMLKAIQNFYNQTEQHENSDCCRFPGIYLRTTLLLVATHLVRRSLEDAKHSRYLEAELSLLTKLLRKSQTFQALNAPALLSSLSQAIRSAGKCKGNDTDFPGVLSLASTLEVVSDFMSPEQLQSEKHINQIITEMVVCLWAYVSPMKPRHAVEAVRSLWRMHQISPESQLVESAITSLMVQCQCQEAAHFVTIDGARRFATLWTHSVFSSSTVASRRLGQSRADSQRDRRSDQLRYNPNVLARPLLLLLDNLDKSRPELFVFVSDWLQSLPNVLVVLELLTRLLHGTPYLVRLRSRSFSSSNILEQVNENDLDEAEECVYFLQLMHNILMLRSTHVLSSLKVPINIPRPTIDNVDKEPTDQSLPAPDDHIPSMTVEEYLIQVCMMVFQKCLSDRRDPDRTTLMLRSVSIALLRNVLPDFNLTSVITELESVLIKTLFWAVEHSELELQPHVMACLEITWKRRLTAPELATAVNERPTSEEYRRSISQVSLSIERSDKDQASMTPASPDPSILDCLIFGLSSPKSRPILEQWVHFLENCLPLYASNALQAMLPLTSCIGRSIDAIFQLVQSTFEKHSAVELSGGEPIHLLSVLFNALEQVLARGHEQIVQDEAKYSSLKSPEQVQSFFGSMVSALSSEAQAARSATANNRLTVLLCFKDTVKISLKLWSWGNDKRDMSWPDPTTSASFNYTSVRLRNRSRRVLENIFSAEPLECLETLIDTWQSEKAGSGFIMNLLYALEASRPKNSMPTIFNAIYSRTNPNVLDPARKSSLISELSDVQLAAFLVAYTKSMDDDALDEVWNDCMTFSRDVLGNPLPHRQVLPLLLEFIAVLGQKIDNTNFGEQGRMRREIGDLFVRLLAAMFTIKPLAFSSDTPTTPPEESRDSQDLQSTSTSNANFTTDVVAIVAEILPNISKLLIETDRITTAIATISTQVLLPAFHWKTFPHNVTRHTLAILKVMSHITEASKTWKRDVAEAFNDPKFFATRSYSLIEKGWMPILSQWALVDKERLPELLSRLPAPTAAGIMFGVGASSARLEADRKAQVNLRRIAFLVLSADDDAFVVNMNGIQEKLAELMNATAASSPSSVTRAEIYMVLRALILKTTPVHFASLWPIINTDLFEALSSIGHIASREIYNITCILQAAKLLDTLLIVRPDDFQLREWLYVTDTVDAVYRPPDWRPVALADELAEVLDNKASVVHSVHPQVANGQKGIRVPLLRRKATKGIPREELMDQVLRPFLRQLSISAFESTYQMESADRKACCEELLQDLFDDGTLV